LYIYIQHLLHCAPSWTVFFPFVSKHSGIFLSMKDTYDAILNCSFMQPSCWERAYATLKDCLCRQLTRLCVKLLQKSKALLYMKNV